MRLRPLYHAVSLGLSCSLCLKLSLSLHLLLDQLIVAPISLCAGVPCFHFWFLFLLRLRLIFLLCWLRWALKRRHLALGRVLLLKVASRALPSQFDLACSLLSFLLFSSLLVLLQLCLQGLVDRRQLLDKLLSLHVVLRRRAVTTTRAIITIGTDDQVRIVIDFAHKGVSDVQRRLLELLLVEVTRVGLLLLRRLLLEQDVLEEGLVGELGRHVQIAVDQDRSAAIVTQRLQHVRRQVLPSRLAHVQPRERALHRVYIRHILQLLIHGDARSRLFGLLHAEARILIAEVRIHLRQNEGEDATLARILPIVAAVHEDVLFARVPVQVAEHDQPALLMDLLHQPLGVENGRVKGLVRSLPAAVQVATCQAAPVVAVDDAVRVEHWDYFEYEVLSEHFGFNVIWVSQKGEDTAHHPGADRLARVHSRGDNDTLALSKVLQIVRRCDGEQLARLSRKSATQVRLSHKLAALRVALDRAQVVSQVCVGVWHRVSEEHQVIVILKRVRERQSVVRFAIVGHVLPNTIDKVTDLFTLFVPSNVFLLALFVRVDRYFHSIVKQSIWFRVIQYIESHFMFGSCVAHLEEEPLCVARRIYVIGHQKIVLHVGHLLCQVQIATLKSRFEKKRSIFRPSQAVQLAVEQLALLVILGEASRSRTQARILALLSEQLALCNERLDVDVVQMAESIALMAVTFLRVDNARIPRIYYILNEVRRIIDLSQLVLTVDARDALLDPIFGSHLEHLAPLAHQIIPSGHLLGCSALKLQEALDCHESDALDGTLDGHIEDSRHFRQNG